MLAGDGCWQTLLTNVLVSVVINSRVAPTSPLSWWKEASQLLSLANNRQRTSAGFIFLLKKKKKNEVFFPLLALEPTHLFPVDYAKDPSPASSCYRWTNEMLAMETFGSPALFIISCCEFWRACSQLLLSLDTCRVFFPEISWVFCFPQHM